MLLLGRCGRVGDSRTSRPRLPDIDVEGQALARYRRFQNDRAASADSEVLQQRLVLDGVAKALQRVARMCNW
jgi:hypothetical protein